MDNDSVLSDWRAIVTIRAKQYAEAVASGSESAPVLKVSLDLATQRLRDAETLAANPNVYKVLPVQMFLIG